MGNDLRWLLSSDQQIPYHDPRVIDLWWQVVRWYKPDVIDYLGDTSDQACWSRWTDGTSSDFYSAIKKSTDQPVLPFVFEQEKPVKEFYERTRALAPKAQLFSALGNHDIRVWPYFDKKEPALVEAITPQSLWGFGDLGIDYIMYEDRPKHRFGDMYVHHGMSVSKHAGESVRNDVTDFGVSMMRGHSHRLGSYFKRYELREETLRGFEIGHMSDVNSEGMGYQNLHQWNKGFAVGYIESGREDMPDGYFPHIQLIEISDQYTCVVNGKLFKA